MAELTEIELVYRSHGRDSIVAQSTFVRKAELGIYVTLPTPGVIEEFVPWDAVKSVRRWNEDTVYQTVTDVFNTVTDVSRGHSVGHRTV